MELLEGVDDEVGLEERESADSVWLKTPLLVSWIVDRHWLVEGFKEKCKGGLVGKGQRRCYNKYRLLEESTLLRRNVLGPDEGS